MLNAIDGISITILIDNSTDILLQDSPNAKRAPVFRGGHMLPVPLAEHGFSALVRIRSGTTEHRFLFDTGVSADGMLRNADLLGVDLDVESIILSHGHFDHFTGLASALERMGKPTKLIVHPDAFLRRWLHFKDGSKARMPDLDEGRLRRLGAFIVRNSKPLVLPSQQEPCLLVTGEIPRTTDYEIGFPAQHAETADGKVVPDPLVMDDQALVANVRNKGLVILSGCGHAGIINTINYARKLTNIETVLAVIGGFHLSGPAYETAIEPTLQDMKLIHPRHLVPCHCTGWKAVNRIIQEFPSEFIQPSVGTTLGFYTD
jgi:7,8-dihydropterin-6-yl-methyl-4-(beta-D-ribofuranosyl)aminobenzene 5'-phosphate synthase